MSKDKRPASPPNQDDLPDSKRSKSTINSNYDSDYYLDYDSSDNESGSPRGRGEGSFRSSRTGGVARSSSNSSVGGSGASYSSNGGVGGVHHNNGGVGGVNYNNGGVGGVNHNNGGVGGVHHNNGGNPLGANIGNGEVGVGVVVAPIVNDVGGGVGDENHRPSTPPVTRQAVNVGTVPPAVIRPPQVPTFNNNPQAVQAAIQALALIQVALTNFNNAVLSTAPTPQGGSPANPGSPATNPGSPGLGGDNNQVGEGGHAH